MRTRRSLGRAAALVAAAALTRPSLAQAYPVRPVQFIVPWGAGGGTDDHARTIAALMERELG